MAGALRAVFTFAYTRAPDRATRTAVWLMLVVLFALALHHALPHGPGSSSGAEPCILCTLLASIVLFVFEIGFFRLSRPPQGVPSPPSVPIHDPALWSALGRRGPPQRSSNAC